MAAPSARAAISWSGGKDAWLAWRRAIEAGLDVRTFVTMCEAGGASLAHALPDDWIAGQVAAIGGASWRVRVPAGRYEARFDAVLARLRASGHTHMVFGDIDLAAHRDWIEPRVVAQGLVAVFPLWREARAALADELIARGVRARVVCVDERALDASFCGRDYDAAFVAALPAGVCPCGEDGEFHTFVFGGPGFARTLEAVNGPRVRVAAAPPMRAGTHVFQRLAGTAPWGDGAGDVVIGTGDVAIEWPDVASGVADRAVEIADPANEMADPAVEMADLAIEMAGLAVEKADVAVGMRDPAIEMAYRVSEMADLAVEKAEVAVELRDPAIEMAYRASEMADLAVEKADVAVEMEDPAIEMADPAIEVADLAIERADLSDEREDLAIEMPDLSSEVADLAVEMRDLAIEVADLAIDRADAAIGATAGAAGS